MVRLSSGLFSSLLLCNHAHFCRISTPKLVGFLSYSYLYALVLINGKSIVSNAQEIETKKMVQEMNDQCCCVEKEREKDAHRLEFVSPSKAVWKRPEYVSMARCQLRHGQVQA